jgi:hypothetical protein
VSAVLKLLGIGMHHEDMHILNKKR